MQKNLSTQWPRTVLPGFSFLFLNYTELSTAQNRINGIKLNMGRLLTVTVDIL